MAKKQQLGSTFDYEIKNISIYTSDGKTVDVRHLMVELDLYEDVFSPCMTGVIVISDALDIISTFAIHGNEFIEIEIDKPTLEIPIYKVFRIYKAAERIFDDSGNQQYRLFFCSEELILSQLILISKSYKGLTTSDIINDILLNNLKVKESKINRNNFEETEINYDIIIPNMRPFAAINWLLTRSYAANKPLFFFYENRDGFNLTSFQTIAKQEPYGTYYRNVKVNTNANENINGFTYLKILEEFDLMRAARYGTFCSKFLSLDIISKEYTEIEYNALASRGDGGILNKEVTMNEFQNRFNRTFYDSYDTMVKFSVINDGDPSKNPMLPDRWLPQKSAKLGQLQLIKLVGSLPGDVLLKAGLVIEVVVQEFSPIEGVTMSEKNKIVSGKYMISSLHHKFKRDYFTTTLEMVTDSVGDYLRPPLNTNEKLRELVKS